MPRLSQVAFVLACLLTGASFASAQSLCPSRKLDNATEIIPEAVRPRPVLFASFLDSAYATCFQRITDDPLTPSTGRPVPAHAALQAWNADQTRILLASGEVLRSPSWAHEITLPQAVASGAPRWAPNDRDRLIYLDGNALKAFDLFTGFIQTLHTFGEYSALDPNLGYHDVSRDGRFLVLHGWRGAIGDMGQSDVFVYDLAVDRKGTVLSGSSPLRGTIEDALISPHGAFALIQWSGTAPDFQPMLEALDSSMVAVGRTAPGSGPFDVTIDADGSEWVVRFASGAHGGIQGDFVVKYRLPDGWDRLGGGDASGGDTLCTWPRQVGGGHVSGRAFDVGYVIVSADGAQPFGTSTRKPFTHEIVKLYLDSSPGAPHLERLADTRSEALFAGGVCGPDVAAAAPPNATVSRDGTRLLWGSTWDKACRAEAYVMDICNKSANQALRDMPVNVWVKLSPATYRYDGTREVADRFPMMQYGRAVFVPEYGAILYWGGGGHGQSRIGNDVWMYDTARNEWRQMTPGDPLSSYPNPGLTTPLFGDYCHNDSSIAYFWSTCTPTSYLPIGSTASGAPWSSEIYGQRAWDSYNRRFVIFGPNYIIGQMDGPPTWFAARASYAYDPYLRSWKFLANDPHLYHQGGTMAFDPVHRRLVAVNHDWWHHAGYNSSADRFNFRWWLDVTTDTWTEKPPLLAPNMFDSDLVYDPLTRRMFRQGGDFPTENELWSYNPENDSWDKLTPAPDPAAGFPPPAAPSAAVNRDGVMLVWGFGGDGECVPTWAYNTQLNSWRKMDALNDPISQAPPNSRVHAWPSLVYDPTNDVFYLLRLSPTENQTDIGYWSNSLVGELWAYRYNAPRSITPVPSPWSEPPPRVMLAQNLPNPFRNSTSIPFRLPGSIRVRLRVFDVQGRVVATLADRTLDGPVNITWNGKDAHGRDAASGIYWYELEAGSFRSAKKMVLLR
jgi:hypothetical protein